MLTVLLYLVFSLWNMEITWIVDFATFDPVLRVVLGIVLLMSIFADIAIIAAIAIFKNAKANQRRMRSGRWA